MWCHGFGYYGSGGWGSILGIFLNIALVGGVIYLVTKLFSKSTSNFNGIAVLEEQYARGEIGREEFLERKNVLKGK